MSVTAVSTPTRTVDLIAVPYGELSYLTANPCGERVEFGAFADACAYPDRVFLLRGHDQAHPIGRAVALWEEPDGLHGTFLVRENTLGDEVLADLKDGYLPACSIGFRPTRATRGPRGETVITAGELREVSLLPIGAYSGARVLAVRRPTDPPFVSTIPIRPTLSIGRGQLGTIRL